MAGEKIADKPAQAAAPAAKPAPAGGPAPTAGLSSDSKLWALLCYVFPVILSIVVIATDKKEDKYVLYHAYQALFLGIVWFVLMIIPIICIIGILWWLAMLYFGYKAYLGEKFALPVVGEMAEKQMPK